MPMGGIEAGNEQTRKNRWAGGGLSQGRAIELRDK